MVQAQQTSSTQVAWPGLAAWLSQAEVQGMPAVVQAWAHMARAAMAGDRAGLAGHLRRLSSEAGGRVEAAAAQFEQVLEVASRGATPAEAGLWRELAACQAAILAEAARPAPMLAQPSSPQLQAIIEFSREIISILNPETLLEQLVWLIYKSFGYEYIHLFLTDAPGRLAVMRGGLWHGQPAQLDGGRALRVGQEGIVGWVAATGQPAVVSDVAADDRYVAHPALPDVRAEMAVPLNVGGRIRGVLDVQSDHQGAFGETDLFLLQALADQVAIAVENARLHYTMQRRLHEQTILTETSAAISADLDADRVLRSIAAKLTEAVSVGGCTICEWHPESLMVTCVAEHVVDGGGNPGGTWRAAGQSIPLADDPVASQVLQTGQPVLIHAGAGRRAAAHGAAWQEPGWKALLAQPLQLEERVIGLIELYDRRASRKFSGDEARLCRALAQQTAIAMERIRLFNETRQRLAEVSELYTLANETATNLDLTQVLDAAVEAIRRALGCRGCCIFMLDEATQTLEIKAAAGLKPLWREAARLAVGEGIAGRVAAEARPVYVRDTLEEKDFIFFDQEVRSLLAVPLQVKGRVIGVINVDDRVPDAFGADQERLLTIAAAQAAIAIENARLFSEVLSEKQRTEAIIRYMADGLLMLDRRGVVVSCNPAMAMMLDLSQKEILGQRVSDPDLDARLRDICQPATVKERTGVLAREVEIPRVGPLGEALRPRILRVYSSGVKNEAGQRIGEVRVVHDISKEREVEELKDEFFSTISHELRTPLFSILGFTRLILEGQVHDEGTEREFIRIIGRQAEQLGQLVNNLLNISRLESSLFELERQPVELVEVVRQTLSKLHSIAEGRGVELQAELPASLPMVTGDRDWLEQVVSNLVSNAIKFTPEGGQVCLAARQQDGDILVEVSDTGIGIPADSLELIFSKFYRVPDEGEERPGGTGLGLHIAKQVVEAHGGRIWAESTAGQGSTLRFTLPIG